jgi:hypothetical protein
MIKSYKGSRRCPTLSPLYNFYATIIIRKTPRFVNNMAETEISAGLEIVSWEVPEFNKHERGRWWYALFGLIAVALIAYAVLSGNFLFAVIILIGGFVMILTDARHPRPVSVTVTTEGVVVGNRFYDYDEMRHFAIVYKPAFDLKRVYFEFKSPMKQRLSLALFDINPLYLREHLSKYLAEDLDRNEEPLSEFVSRLLKL